MAFSICIIYKSSDISQDYYHRNVVTLKKIPLVYTVTCPIKLFRTLWKYRYLSNFESKNTLQYSKYYCMIYDYFGIFGIFSIHGILKKGVYWYIEFKIFLPLLPLCFALWNHNCIFHILYFYQYFLNSEFQYTLCTLIVMKRLPKIPILLDSLKYKINHVTYWILFVVHYLHKKVLIPSILEIKNFFFKFVLLVLLVIRCIWYLRYFRFNKFLKTSSWMVYGVLI